MFDFLKKMSLFSGLAAEDLKRLCEKSIEISLMPGEVLFDEGDPGVLAYVIVEGEIEIGKLSDGINIQLAIRSAGELIGEMSLLEDALRMAGAQAISKCRLLAISRDQLEELLVSNPSSALSMLRTVTGRLRETESTLRQKEKMAHLGTLSAGMAHELNNPASAVQRGSVQLGSALTRILEISIAFNQLQLSTDQKNELINLLDGIDKLAEQPDTLNSLERSDKEQLFEEWLEKRDIDDAPVHAPEMVSMGYQIGDLDKLEKRFSLPILQDIINLVCAAYVAYKVLYEIAQGSSQIASVVKAMKNYVYLDQAPLQDVNIHEGLENTLIILKHKLKQGVQVVKEFDKDLPLISGYGSELNQVWTNLIDNAADALEGSGVIILRSRVRDSWVIVEVEDNGPGIPEENTSQIFTLFFTTKPMGQGSGQGMHITYNIIRRHGGLVEFSSEPGKTVFTVCLPMNFQENSTTVPSMKGDKIKHVSDK